MTSEDEFRVNIIAAPPSDSARIPDEFIDHATAKLQASAVPLLTASSIVDIDQRIAEAQDMPERQGRRLAVQIIGHASSGQLFLGSTWMTRPDGTTPPEVFRHPYHVLTTNPSALGYLYKHAGKLASFDLVGCNVGAAWNDGGYAFSGRTLTYTLCELLRTDVTGAVELVDPEELVGGSYGPKRAPPDGWTYNENGPPSFRQTRDMTPRKSGYPYNGESTQLLITQVTDARLPIQDPTFPKHTRILLEAVPLEIEPRLRVASKELSITVENSARSQATPAALFGNARFLAIEDTVYFIQNGSQVSQRIADLLWNR